MKIILIFIAMIFFSFSASSFNHPITKSKINNNFEDECKEINEQIEIYIHNYLYDMKNPGSGVPLDHKRRLELKRAWLNPAEKLVSIKNGICKD